MSCAPLPCLTASRCPSRVSLRIAAGVLTASLVVGCRDELTTPRPLANEISPALAATASPNARATVMELPWLADYGAQEPKALGVNDGGDVVGTTFTFIGPDGSDDAFRASLWLAGASVGRALPTLGGINSGAHAINNRGDVVGWSNLANGEVCENRWTAPPPCSSNRHATLWPAGGGPPRNLGTLGGANSEATDINDRGDVIGWSNGPNDASRRPTLWPGDGGPPRELSSLGGTQSRIFGINNRGDIVGSSQTPDGSLRAAIWPEGGPARTLGALVGAYSGSSAWTIDDQGNIAGWSGPADGSSARRTLWPADGGPPRDLGPVAPMSHVYPSVGTSAMTARGDVVGDQGSDGTAVLWPIAGEPPQDLGALAGARVSSATAISATGYVAGWGATAAGRRVAYRWFIPATNWAPDPATVVRVYKDHDAWRSTADGGRDERTLRKIGLVKGKDFAVHPMSSLASGIPDGTRVVIITANSRGDPATSAAQRSDQSQQALVGFLRTGGTLLVDLADNEANEGYRVPGASGTPSLPSGRGDCARGATLAAAALGADGVVGTADDHRFVRGPDGVAGTEDDLDNEKIDLAHGATSGMERTSDRYVRGCSVVHGDLQDGITLPIGARVLATWTLSGEKVRPVLAEYCHMGGRVIVNTFTLGYFGHKPREGALEPLRSSYIQTSLFTYALSMDVREPLPTVAVPADLTVNTDPGLETARVDVGTPSTTENCSPGAITVTASRSDGAELDAPYHLGTTTITWTRRDEKGNEAVVRQTVTVSDAEPPTVTGPKDVTVNATQPGGGVVRWGPPSPRPGFAWTDNVKCEQPFPAGVDGYAALCAKGIRVECRGGGDNSSSRTLFPAGVNTVSCTFHDRSDNSTTRTWTVTVLGVPEQLTKLSNIVKGSKIVVSYKRTLMDMVASVLADHRAGMPGNACRGLDLFIDEAAANGGTIIPADKARRMIADARRIKNVIGCDPPSALLLRPDESAPVCGAEGCRFKGVQGASLQANTGMQLRVLPATTVTWASSDPSGSNASVNTTGLVAVKRGNDDINTANEVIITATHDGPAPAPSGTIRINSFTFDHFPRTMLLVWRPVAGAARYDMTLDYGECSGPPAACTVWTQWHRLNTFRTTETLDFIGAQPGRWRVVARDAAGNVLSTSEYAYFSFVR